MAAVKHADSVFEKMQLRGKWWLPENPDHTVDGVLTGSESEGFELQVSGSLSGVGNLLRHSEEGTHQLIHGQTSTGPVTLCDSFLIHNNFSSSGHSECRYYSNFILNGVPLESFDQLHFRTLRAQFSVLCDWVNARVFETNLGTDLKNPSVTFSFPAGQVIYECEQFSVELGFGYSGFGQRLGQNQFSVDWEPQLVIKSKDAQLPWYSNASTSFCSILDTLNAFLAVVAQGACYTFDMVASADLFVSVPSDNPEKQRYKEISVLRQLSIETAQYDLLRVLFPWSHIAENPTPYFEKWFSMHSKLRGPISLFVGSLTQRNRYSPDRFFNMMSALEGLHRHICPQASEASDKDRRRVAAILGSAPENQRTWLEEKLQYSHEPSLRRRLKLLMRPFDDILAWLLGEEGNRSRRRSRRSRVIGAIADSRNCLAHGLPEVGRQPGYRYSHFTRIAELLMSMWLMKETGIDDQVIVDRMMNNYYTKQIRDRLVEFLRSEL